MFRQSWNLVRHLEILVRKPIMMVVGIRIKIYPKAKKNPYPAIAAG
jgi:hypothetical protein